MGLADWPVPPGGELTGEAPQPPSLACLRANFSQLFVFFELFWFIELFLEHGRASRGPRLSKLFWREGRRALCLSPGIAGEVGNTG